MSKKTTLPYGEVKDNKLIMEFSAFDIDLPVVAAGIRERSDVLREIDVIFAGFGSELPENVSRQSPVTIKAFFEYVGKGDDVKTLLKRAYHLVWSGMIQEFPDLTDWAAAKADLSSLTFAQAELLNARGRE
ncbi:MAG: hypothetical protein ACOC38_04160 [Promethearchaeia archaeon]